ncbi:aminotransferase class I/II-fold pyridoxal phosphate-dependent enzyme [Dyadobacter sp. Leaf189]|uniref:aminotransferase class I/II-fold pyridoxal phosphate-dependent enzyme n=1 Tax=Dyadobacter sp. Leaf189 TaxID=1736295 RepID=UPI0006F2F74A|nr:aminotransferase class I/II-fold pyridoxal phosphate-dependent enzyme [Dyadobacter sp. Leaf189]KQS25491.1 pyridoxal phosphate-dependent aminotransferase [Dyadobacter sp. Leaf189]
MDYKIWLSPPHLGGKELQYIQDAFESNWIASAGPHLDHFESGLCAYTGSKHAVALSSGTAALHLALVISGVKKGDIVLCQSLTFAASANPILYLGATPVFIDSEPQTWNICPDALEQAVTQLLKSGKKPKALICVHLYGMPCQLKEVTEICDKYGIVLIEDAAEAMGSTYQGQHLGTFGQMGVASFNGNKIITTSAGGALFTYYEMDARKARFLASQAKDPAPYFQHSELGYNYRMSNICAAIGLGQLEILNERVAQRRRNFKCYLNAFETIPGLSLQEEKAGMFSNRWLSTFLFDPEKSKLAVDQIRLHLAGNGIEARQVWKPMHLQPLYKDAQYFGGNVAVYVFTNGICFPSGSALNEDNIGEICESVLTLAGM